MVLGVWTRGRWFETRPQRRSPRLDVDRVLHGLTRLELNGLLGGNLHGRLGAWVAAHACTSVRDAEGSETDEGHFLSTGQRVLNCGGHCTECTLGVLSAYSRNTIKITVTSALVFPACRDTM